MTNVVINQIKIVVIGKNSQGNSEILEIDNRDYGKSIIYKVSFVTYLSDKNISQNDIVPDQYVKLDLMNYTLQS